MQLRAVWHDHDLPTHEIETVEPRNAADSRQTRAVWFAQGREPLIAGVRRFNAKEQQYAMVGLSVAGDRSAL